MLVFLLLHIPGYKTGDGAAHSELRVLPSINDQDSPQQAWANVSLTILSLIEDFFTGNSRLNQAYK